MQAWEESGIGPSGRSRRDFDDFDEMDDDEFGPDEESEFAVRYLEDEDDEDGDADESEEELYELEEEPPGGVGGQLQPEEW